MKATIDRIGSQSKFFFKFDKKVKPKEGRRILFFLKKSQGRMIPIICFPSKRYKLPENSYNIVDTVIKKGKLAFFYIGNSRVGDICNTYFGNDELRPYCVEATHRMVHSDGSVSYMLEFETYKETAQSIKEKSTQDAIVKATRIEQLFQSIDSQVKELKTLVHV